MTRDEELRQLRAGVEAKARRAGWRAVILPDGHIVEGESAWRSLLRVWSQKSGLMAMRLFENLEDQLEDRAPTFLPNMMVHEAVVLTRDSIADNDLDADRGEDPFDGFDGGADDEHFLAASIEYSTARELTACPPLEPLAAQVAMLDRIVAWAKRRGLRLPAFEVCWVRGRREICAGAINLEDGRYRMFLNADVYPSDLQETVAHEVAHLHDLHAGRRDRVDLERRAIWLASKALEECRW